MAERLYEGQTFEGLRLEDEYLDHLRFVDCHFINCTFEGGVLTDCAFAACTWTGCKVINVTSRRTQIRSLSFEQCDLVGLTAADWLPASRFATAERLTNCLPSMSPFSRWRLLGLTLAATRSWTLPVQRVRPVGGILPQPAADGVCRLQLDQGRLPRGDGLAGGFAQLPHAGRPVLLPRGGTPAGLPQVQVEYE